MQRRWFVMAASAASAVSASAARAALWRSALSAAGRSRGGGGGGVGVAIATDGFELSASSRSALREALRARGVRSVVFVETAERVGRRPSRRVASRVRSFCRGRGPRSASPATPWG